ncbi:putative type I restriction enzymeP M protein [Phycisphaerae bacterium RAS1]|nr:putative type I restriction enzymeP M protein [Phycisphaerae bacterium RAS1]
MDHGQLNWIANFIWNIADDVLRDVYVRGKYRDVILPMTVIRRLDALLEPTKPSVLKMKEQLDNAKIANQHAALCQAAGQAFYNTSPFTLRDLKARAKQQQLKADFEAYLDGFSSNVQEILDKFKFRNQISTLVDADILGHLIEKFLDSTVNLSPKPVFDADGKERLSALDNHAMGTIFEELIRRFNEENNEEAGEHFTPRDVVRLMSNLIFLPIADQVESGTYLVYDGACGTGGMLTVAEETLVALARAHGRDVSVHLFGEESQPETYAISKADLLLKGEGEAAENMKYGSTLSADAFPSHEFDFMLSNPPYGKSWKTDLDRMGGKAGLSDARFVIQHGDDPEYSLVTRSSDGQLMFLVNKLSKMKHGTKLGSRIAEVHNGSSLFTGDAGQGESNIRRWIIENDWLEAIVALPLNMFYNTGIATYIWVLTNRKPERRKGKMQLIDATEWFKPLRKNLGKKNCELAPDDIRRICHAFLAFEETPQSKIFRNEAFGYWKITVERPLRLRTDITPDALAAFKRTANERLHVAAEQLMGCTSGPAQMDFNLMREQFGTALKRSELKLKPSELNQIFAAFTKRDERAEPVIKKKTRDRAEYEPDPELRDTEQVPLLEPGGIEAFFDREVRPHAPDAWIDHEATKVGYEISFTRYFYKPQKLRTLDEIRTEILAIEAESEGLLHRIVADGGA